MLFKMSKDVLKPFQSVPETFQGTLRSFKAFQGVSECFKRFLSARFSRSFRAFHSISRRFMKSQGLWASAGGFKRYQRRLNAFVVWFRQSQGVSAYLRMFQRTSDALQGVSRCSRSVPWRLKAFQRRFRASQNDKLQRRFMVLTF